MTLRGPLGGFSGRPAGENAGAMRANKRLRPGDGLERNILTEGALKQRPALSFQRLDINQRR
jgi:hypothetical protein